MIDTRNRLEQNNIKENILDNRTGIRKMQEKNKEIEDKNQARQKCK